MISVIYMFDSRRVSFKRKRFSWLSLATQRQAPVNYRSFHPENGLDKFKPSARTNIRAFCALLRLF